MTSVEQFWHRVRWNGVWTADPVGQISEGSMLAFAEAYADERTAALIAALREAHKYFRNRPGNEEVQLCEMIGKALSKP